MSAPIRLALTPPVGGQVIGDDIHLLVDIARICEQGAVDTLVVVDHVIMGERHDRYDWGRFAFGNGAPWPEPLTVMAAMAGATSRLRFATGILIAGLRRPALLAKTVATLDRLSLGRIDLGVGIGWQPEEYEAMDLDFTRRGRIMDETIAACQRLWADGPAHLPSASGELERTWCDPKPVQPGGPPIWFSGVLHANNIRRIATMGRGWIPIMGATTDDITTGIGVLRDALAAEGRAADELLVRAPLPLARAGGAVDLAATLAAAPTFAAAGATEVSLPMSVFVSTMADVEPFVDRLTAAWASLWP
ncbi:MAG: TIGR03619 family F420-dependent LLM class oxidoreductase [Ilumatobacteraceae bacterium]|jgi:probable F420-dependent oxidoreductase